MPARPSETTAADLLTAVVGLISNWTAAVTQGSIAAAINLDIAEGDVRALYVIGQHRAGVQPAALAAELRLSRPTMSKTLSRLATAGLIDRTPSRTDARSALIELSESGQTAYDGLVLYGIRMVERATAGLRPDEIGTVTEVARKLLQPEPSA
ncbi:DNA-binding MarR family transcriptional regulator [Leucobacter komagatae]|uniref:DNA-binding MarR family transcriptional regulator n=1 Tax=Leucobacter komagatae TaxID=55969 RepID=A0A542Y5F2_9MICO|nr:MarR family transcriptional regulator [Leucobacter komagatae]TQL43275.1 DNA-binding MarR family transcriptional regulator [Leucobacter komagatae]